MSISNTYRNTIKRKKDELNRLRTQRASEFKKISTSKNKILSAHRVLKRTKSASTIRMKFNEIEREEKRLADINKKLADYDKKISKKEKEIFELEKKLHREIEREQKKRDVAEKKRLAQSENYKEEVNRRLEELAKLPEKITVLFMASNPLNAQQLRLDEAARVFAAQFYSAVGFGLSLSKAFEQGKAALMLEGIPEEDIPELYLAENVNPDELILVQP